MKVSDLNEHQLGCLETILRWQGGDWQDFRKNGDLSIADLMAGRSTVETNHYESMIASGRLHRCRVEELHYRIYVAKMEGKITVVEEYCRNYCGQLFKITQREEPDNFFVPPLQYYEEEINAPANEILSSFDYIGFFSDEKIVWHSFGHLSYIEIANRLL
jgi:hypothetical protein